MAEFVDEQPKGLLALVRDYDDRERAGLRRLLYALPPEERRRRQAEVERTWGRIRQDRNRLALARMTPGNSMAGMRNHFPWFYPRRFPLGSPARPGPFDPHCLLSGDASAVESADHQRPRSRTPRP